MKLLINRIPAFIHCHLCRIAAPCGRLVKDETARKKREVIKLKNDTSSSYAKARTASKIYPEPQVFPQPCLIILQKIVYHFGSFLFFAEPFIFQQKKT
jgi:hypothetical protein